MNKENENGGFRNDSDGSSSSSDDDKMTTAITTFLSPLINSPPNPLCGDYGREPRLRFPPSHKSASSLSLLSYLIK